MTQAVSSEEKNIIQDNPEITEMYRAGLHFGYGKTRRHPGMRPFILGTKGAIEVFDLTKTHIKLVSTLDEMRALGKEGKTVLFVGTKASAKDIVRRVAEELNMPHVTQRWIGGAITNFKVIFDRVQYWQDLKRKKESGELKKYTKHEQTKLAQEIEKLDYIFGGLESMTRLPHALFVVDIGEENLAIREASRRNIPVLAVSSSDTNPATVQHIIPANDNARASIEYVLSRVEQAYKEGYSIRVPAEPTSSEASE